MLKRHVELREYVCKLDDMEFDNVLLHASFVRRIGGLLAVLDKLNKVVLKLQVN